MASSELLKQIQAGKKLKKSETNDRSAPAIDAGPKSGGAGRSIAAPAVPSVAAAGGGSAAGPPQLGGLFAGGMPKLKPATNSSLGRKLLLSKRYKNLTIK